MSFLTNTINSASPFWQSMIGRWRQLSRREQWLTATALVTLFIWLIWQGLMTPLAEQQALAEKKVAASRAQLTQIQQQAEQVLSLRASGATARPVSNMPMDQTVHQLAGRYQLVIQRVQRANGQDETLDIDLANARFDKLIGWLTTLEQQHRIKVASIQLEATDTSGFVEVRRLQLERG
ncbi:MULTISPECIES: type II secretion system protein M [Gammaproteobacteria]|uniref:type II secretion system protein GspM n=1 Tax=Gammaproteobacteria TaxID=1236 RepID=UPI001ADC7315|nr:MULTISPECIES: type II secretion system protein M [Gammaproteobacteria]MBO9482794.1 type II secretion system protein M [Salinisphaera sp. G21_0]MBO9495158.1 type II secretion system protein M [Thalassotalea sp. G20_0]